jgi:hypothetical protein
MTKKELKEIIYNLCDILDSSPTDSEKYKKALKDLKRAQNKLKTN